jgi:hyaluronan synthase/N-acetylglucosaminyltransferase
MAFWYTALAVFITIYAVLTFGYLIYRYLFSVIHSIEEVKRHHRIDRSWNPLVSIVIPCYNEVPEDLEKCIVASCDNSYPNKEIIVIDDGSKNKESWETIKRLQKIYKFRAIQFKTNKGKREGMTVGFKEARGEFIITMDSDSIIVSGDSIYELIHPFRDPTVGAVSGNIQVLKTIL